MRVLQLHWCGAASSWISCSGSATGAFWLSHKPIEIDAAISEKESLNALCWIPYKDIDTSYLPRICQNLSELTDLQVEFGASNWDDLDDLLPRIIRSAAKVQRIRLEGKTLTITADNYERLHKIAQTRSEANPLSILISPQSLKGLKAVCRHQQFMRLTTFWLFLDRALLNRQTSLWKFETEQTQVNSIPAHTHTHISL